MKNKIKTYKQQLIEKYVKRIKIDYPEDDKLIMDLQQFEYELNELSNRSTCSKIVEDFYKE